MKIIQSVERAFMLLQLLDGSGPLGVLELSRRSNLKQPTVHNFLQTLTSLGYVEQDSETSKYLLSDNTKFLGWSGNNKRLLTETARPLIVKLFEEYNETVLLTVPANNIRITIMRLNSSRPLSVRTELRLDTRLYDSATGRCLLSGMSDAELDSVIYINGWPQPGEWDTVNNLKTLKAELAKIRKAGTAQFISEGIVAIGATIQVPEKMINAALGLYLPEARFQGKFRKEIKDAISNTASEIARLLGESHP